jgi:NADPH:quinone reductase-like Zn-dependent oxidoreductase
MKPNNISFDEAVAVPATAVTALLGLRDRGRIKSGRKVLINGAAGGVGTFSVQIAKAKTRKWTPPESEDPTKEEPEVLKKLLEHGKVVPVIDRRYPLSELAEAIGYVAGHARSKVVITI